MNVNADLRLQETQSIFSDLSDFPEYQPRPKGARLPLEGIRIVDFTHFIAGPLATTILADMGADVVKVEAPGKGDDFRQYPPFNEDLGSGPPFIWTNRNKRSISLDLKSPGGQKLALQLIAKADVVVENFSTGVMDRLGLGYEVCKKGNPKLIYCSVSAYGREGAFADRGGFDPLAQAESGYISMNGYPDREGVRSLSPVMDISTAMMTSNALLGALLARDRCGTGQYVEVALFDTAVMMTGYAPLQHLSGRDPIRTANTSPDTCPSGQLYASDRGFMINCGNNQMFQRLMTQVVDLPEAATEPRFSTNKNRLACREEIFALLQAEFSKRPWDYWKGKLREAGVPSGEIRTVGEAIRSPEALERKVVTRVRHPKLGWVPNVALPIRYSETPIKDPEFTPHVGEHTEAVLADWLLYDESQLAAVIQSGACGSK